MGEKVLKKFDKEYATQFTQEMKFLLSKGIKYTFVKEIALVEFYSINK